MWARVDDGWWCHSKVLTLSLAARGLWVTAISWSCAQRTDVVPDNLVVMVASGSKLEANELASAGLWEPVEGGWRIHDWHYYQDLSVSEQRAEAGRKGGLKSRPPGKQTGSNPKQPDVLPEANEEAGTHPIPTQPVSTKPAGDTSSPRARAKQACIRIAERAISDRIDQGEAIARPSKLAKLHAEEDLWPVHGEKLEALAAEHPEADRHALADMLRPVQIDPWHYARRSDAEWRARAAEEPTPTEAKANAPAGLLAARARLKAASE